MFRLIGFAAQDWWTLWEGWRERVAQQPAEPLRELTFLEIPILHSKSKIICEIIPSCVYTLPTLTLAPDRYFKLF